MISVFFDINWFFFGLEKFKITINRNIIIKICSIICIFFFVRETSDLWIYSFIMAGSVLVSQIYLMFHLKKYITYQKVTLKQMLSHLKGCLILFIPVLAYGIYRVMDKTMIGAISSVVELGYYENAEKIINIPISIITALGTVMLPHMSYLLKKADSEFKEKILDSMKLALIISVTMACSLFLLADDAAVILFGEEFLKSGIIMRILSVTIIISAWANVIRTQFLIPKNKDKIYVYSTLGGAIINVIFNLVFISKFGALGACIGTILAELFVMLYQTIYTKNDLETKKYTLLLLEILLKGIIIIIIAYLITFKINHLYWRFGFRILILLILIGLFYYKYIIYEFFNIKKKKIKG